MIESKYQKCGFTLIELMLVISIISILAAIAIPNFLKYQLKSKTAEAKTNLGSIKIVQEVYKSEYDTFVLCAPNPNNTPGISKSAWIVPNFDFHVIGFAPVGDVYYSYQAIAGPAGINSSVINLAEGDLDGDGGSGIAPGGLAGAIVGSGAAIATNGLFSQNETGDFADENPGIW